MAEMPSDHRDATNQSLDIPWRAPARVIA